MISLKKFKICFFTSCAALLLSTSVYANPITATTGTIADGGSGPGIQVKLSPGVSLGYTLNATGSSFATNTENVNIKYDTSTGAIQNRNEYGIASDYPGYYMRPAAASAISVPGAADSTAFKGTGDGWVAQ